MTNAYTYQDILAKLGIDIPKLGCVMLDTEPFDPQFPEEWLYTSSHPDRWWIKGNVSTTGAHVTLLYGLLEHATDWAEHIDTLIGDIDFKPIAITSWGYFPSTFEDEPYICIIGHVETHYQIREAHARLSFLPHIDTHMTYKPHVTVAYVKREFAGKAIDMLKAMPTPQLQPIKYNLGTKK